LAIVILHGKSRWSAARMWLALLAGRLHRLRDASGLMRRECAIETDPVQFVDVDGEVITHTPARFSLAEEALRVVVPESFDEPWD
jgi:diacylglycerol kinase family enzyme